MASILSRLQCVNESLLVPEASEWKTLKDTYLKTRRSVNSPSKRLLVTVMKSNDLITTALDLAQQFEASFHESSSEHWLVGLDINLAQNGRLPTTSSHQMSRGNAICILSFWQTCTKSLWSHISDYMSHIANIFQWWHTGLSTFRIFATIRTILFNVFHCRYRIPLQMNNI